ncbi:MAG TPA: ABC transporter permease [Vicinamibacterales bacterium]|nr:ABC transporter permease [Vicinamibacterales bacterium]
MPDHRSFDDIIEELSQHLRDRYEELRASGLTADAARRDLQREFEGEPSLHAAMARALPRAADEPVQLASPRATPLGGLWNDVRYALRTFALAPGFTAIVVITLALGIGATTAIFSVFDTVLLRPLPYPDVERLVAVSERTTTGHSMSISWPNFEDWRAQNDVFEHFGIYRNATVNLTGGDEPERLNAAHASSAMFAAIGIAPEAGRVFGADDDRPGAARTAVVSDRLWRSRFSADPRLIGRVIELNGEPYQIAGIMPPAMRFPSRLVDVWLPFGLIVPTFPPRGAHPGLASIAKLKSGISLERAEAAMDAIARRLERQYPDSNKNSRVALQPYVDQVVQNIRPALVVLIGAVGFVLLIACANLANLTLSRAEGRHREIAIRAALGAVRRRIVQQLLVESLLLSMAGGAAGALIAYWSVRAFVASQPATVPRIDLVAVDGRVLLFTAALSLLTGVLFGLVPAWRASAPDLAVTLKETARSTTTSRRLRSTLVVVEVALAMVLLVAAGLTIRSFARLMAIDPGFNPDDIVTVRLTLPAAKYPTAERWLVFHRELLRRVREIPGVEAAGLNSAVPLEGGGAEAPIVKEGDPLPTPDHPSPATLFQTTSPGYFRAMGIALVAGRDFDERDGPSSPLVAIVDESVVRTVFGGADPIGKRIAFEMAGGHQAVPQMIWREVVGVVHHVRHYGLAGEPPFVQVYAPYGQLPVYMQQRMPSMALVTRTALAPDAFTASLRRELAAIDRDIPIYQVQTMERYLQQNTEQPRLSVTLLSLFGGLSLLLAVVGVYGVLSYTVNQRRQEIGIRLALGASRGDVLRLIVGHGVMLAGAGLAIGGVAAWLLAGSLRSGLFEISPHDGATFACIAATLFVCASAASYLPGRRAARVDPAATLRAG